MAERVRSSEEDFGEGFVLGLCQSHTPSKSNASPTLLLGRVGITR
jgi:hypothetical protein